MPATNDIVEPTERSEDDERKGKGLHTSGQRSSVRMLILSAAILAFLGAVVALLPLLIRPNPERILKMASDAHSAINAMHMRAQVTIEPLIKVPIEITANLERPNKLHGTITLKGTKAPSMLMVSDGKRIWTFVKQWKQCQVEPAPKDMASTWGMFKPVGKRDDHRENMAAALFCGFKPEGNVKRAKLLGTENIGHHKCHMLHITYADGFEQLIHVGVKDSFVWQTVTKTHLSMPPPLPPIEIIITSKCTSIVPNPKFEQRQFTFTPPKGTRMVESLSPPKED
ncbi:MAG: DUF2092 domain-containing protein [Armatimonadota bacterium]|nr:DUF2092 domain-containing protein [Armatimonadota bacterium]MDW8025993.1 DUF2092 domain-containing protein [Armatimonadota bacterium]